VRARVAVEAGVSPEGLEPCAGLVVATAVERVERAGPPRGRRGFELREEDQEGDGAQAYDLNRSHVVASSACAPGMRAVARAEIP
jgi:hypothetical protein